jgi:hypothetical protein
VDILDSEATLARYRNIDADRKKLWLWKDLFHVLIVGQDELVNRT